MDRNFCIKCNHKPADKKKFDKFLCSVCHQFSPDNQKEFVKYIQEKIDGSILETFRKHNKLRGEEQKKGMIKKASQGKLMSRAPFGYKIENKNLVPDENSTKEVISIFEDFLGGLSLNKLSQKYSFSINGLKKILTNFTYIGKIKFNGQIHEGIHEPIISSTLFNHVQDKLEELGIKR